MTLRFEVKKSIIVSPLFDAYTSRRKHWALCCLIPLCVSYGALWSLNNVLYPQQNMRIKRRFVWLVYICCQSPLWMPFISKRQSFENCFCVAFAFITTSIFSLHPRFNSHHQFSLSKCIVFSSTALIQMSPMCEYWNMKPALVPKFSHLFWFSQPHLQIRSKRSVDL